MKILACASLAILFITKTSAQGLPPGEGREVVQKLCGVCHAPEAVLKYRTSRAEWSATVDNMVNRGAEGTPEEFQTVLHYLAKYRGPTVYVNSATARELETELEISSKDAAAIVQRRQDKGRLKEWADLETVPGLDVRKIAPLRGRITF
jgi:DNA uptake protein ComE-like DNA-binding protein